MNMAIHMMILVTLLVIGGTTVAEACSVCFGAAGAPLTKALNAGIFSLLAIVAVVLSGLAVFFIQLFRKARQANAQQVTFEI